MEYSLIGLGGGGGACICPDHPYTPKPDHKKRGGGGGSFPGTLNPKP